MSSGACADNRPSGLPGPRALARAHPVVLALSVITLAGAAIRFWHIGHQSFWYDESFTVQLLQHSPGKMIGLFARTETTPPLYYCVAWVWARIFGLTEVGLRSLSAVAGTATIVLAYLLGERLMSRRAGLAAAALVAFNPFLIWYSQEARSYSTLVFISTLSLLAFVWAFETPATGHRLVVRRWRSA